MTGPFSPHHVAELGKRAISVEAAVAAGVRSLQTVSDLLIPGMPERWAEHLPALAFPWTGPDGRIEWQIRPDMPPLDESGRPQKYLGRSKADGFEPTLWVAKRGADDGRRILVEGSCQTVAAATYAGAADWVIGMFGCYGWSAEGAAIPDLWLLEGQRVSVAMDGDMWTNPDVWGAGQRLLGELANVGAAEIRWVKMSNGAKAPGLDDVLARQPEDKRSLYLSNLVDAAVTEKFPRSRTPKAEDSTSQYFNEYGLKVAAVVAEVRARQPVALTAEANRVACYRDGRYGVDETSFVSAMFQILGDRYRNEHRSNTETALASQLADEGIRLPEAGLVGLAPGARLLNVPNGMLDLNTARLLPHDPSYLSVFQVPVPWDPNATCPTYDRWITETIPEQAGQLEELMWTMLDTSTVPTKAGFLIGPARSGKGTFLRIAQAMAGDGNTSQVSLHQLCSDPFSAANLYGKRLNAAGDLSSAHISDVSVFKQLTGEDTVNANRKYGHQFSFRNQALFLFAANEIPSVSERSNAYLTRMVPFLFGRSFDGRENPAIEKAMLQELPGILKRWVMAGLRLQLRGRRLDIPPAVAGHFAESSDRVRRFITEACKVTDCAAGQVMAEGQASTIRDLHYAFKLWAEEQGGAVMGRTHFADRLRNDPRVREVYLERGRRRGVNLVAIRSDDWE